MRVIAPLLAGLCAAFMAVGCDTAGETAVTIRVLNAETGEPVPARVEVSDSEGRFYFASDAIPVTLECLLSPLPAWLAPLRNSAHIYNPYLGTEQFYIDGTAHVRLPRGKYRMRVAKGLEWRRVDLSFEVVDGEERQIAVELTRWADPAKEGWYGVDDHLHITRMHPDENQRIATWMRAEGLHIANLLEMGTANQLSVSPQYEYGDGGAYRDGPVLLLTGEEHPRTHLMGHTITLGTETRVDERDEYIVYESTFAEGVRQGGVSGFAHFGMGNAKNGLAVVAPTGLVKFIEVLQFEMPYYDIWYQLLNLGMRIAPSAGTDFPCGPPSLPGRERFYVQIKAPVDRRNFVEALRAGRTFVTNGPLVELTVNGVGPGGDVTLAAPAIVSVRGRVRFDPDQDQVDLVELIVNGNVVREIKPAGESGLIEFSFELPINRAAWMALRTSGTKPVDDGPMMPPIPQVALDVAYYYASGAGGLPLLEFRNAMTERPSSSHTGAIYVEVSGAAVRPADGELAAQWLTRLDDLEERLSLERIAEIPIMDWIPYSDGVSEDHLRRNRVALLAAIAKARVYYTELNANPHTDEGS